MFIQNNSRVLGLLGLSFMLLSCTRDNMHETGMSAECLSADLVLHNTKIYTANEAQWTAEATAVLGDKIIFVGSNADAAQYICGDARIMDMTGKYVYAGFTDSHQHVEGIGQRPKTLSLFGIATLAETVDAIKAYSEGVPADEWVQGRGWIEREWTDEKRFLSKQDVDPFTADKPLFMPRADGVSALVNSRALALAGINKDSPDPLGGKFERDAEGNPNGYILATAMDIFRDIIPAKTRAYKKDSLVQGMYENAKLGWTNTQDAGMPYVNVDIMKEIHAEGNMSTRIYAAANVAEAATLLKRGREATADNMFELRGIKVYIDGTLGSRGAFQEDIRGSVEVGKYADFTIFDRDWLEVTEAEILTSENLMTIVGGKVTYQK